MLNHALIKGALFMCIGAVVFRTGKVTIEELGGIGRRMPIDDVRLRRRRS